ncbi:MAG TPA: Rne/Rng family ribonuclease [Devosia sp.]|nr:Rne/Rng family ribonuclease [Devosia sp.]
MATKRMLVDAIHPEETRIVVTNGNRLEEFDFESASRRQLRGNIYLAKVTRVEPSLQAAFIEYGGNRHGFLAFSEIHPDYYQIPVADREALLREEEEDDHHDDGHDDHATESAAANITGAENVSERAAPSEADAEADPQSVSTDDGEHHDDEDGSNVEQAPLNSGPVESVGGSGADALEEMPERRRAHTSRRNYKIQEVIKRRQVMLVQVVKEERGNKGAALTTYLSLAGRYSVLMPNTARGGGISRKITNAADRKRLKDIVGDLEVPQGQGIILRTAGASRTKAEVKRDFEYLQRLWENVRTLTLQSTAPCLVYEEGSLIKRTIRDLYSKEIDELFVAGDEALREAKDFMRMIMPSHAKNVQAYKEDQPIFSKYNIEGQLDSMFSPQVTLPSGGYIVINPTEALVSIDVNSGRATKEHNIEDTALQTNLEAAEEISRQLRLRDLAGLIVIDFIDMMENRSNRAVERKLKECLKNDRARIQVGRISHFGLMEMSRQRIRFGVVESSTHKCPTCQGTGLVRSVESLALMVMRNVEEHVLRKPGMSINVKVPTDVALYILNSKRMTLSGLEQKHNLSINLIADDHVGPSHFAIERGEQRIAEYRDQQATTHVRVDTAAMDDADDLVEDEAEEAVEEESTEGGERQARPATTDEAGDRNGRRRRRRRGRGGERGERDERAPQRPADAAEAPEGVEAAADADGEGDAEGEGRPANGEEHLDDSGEPRRRRRRGRRGGRRNRRGDETGEHLASNADAEPGVGGDDAADAPEEVVAAAEPASAPADAVVGAVADVAVTEPVAAEPVAEEAPAKPKRARRTRKSPDADAAVQDAPVEAEVTEEAPAKPKRVRRTKAASAEAAVAEEAAAPVAADPAPAPVAEAASAPAAVQDPAPEEAPRRARKELPADEIVVSSTAAPEGEQPKKKGWWNRGFFG